MWKKVINSNEEKPLDIEYVEIDDVYYVRKNIEHKKVEDDTTYYIWEYDETIVSSEDWDTFKQIVDNSNGLEKNISLVSYVAMMTNVDLPEE